MRPPLRAGQPSGRPRPRGRSGGVTTSAGRWGESARRRSTATANSDVPRYATLNSSRRAPGLVPGPPAAEAGAALAQRPQGRLALIARGPVEHEHAVEVVDLVLEDAGLEARRLNLAGARRRRRPRGPERRAGAPRPPTTRGRLKHPSSATTTSLREPVDLGVGDRRWGVASGPAWKTRSRCITPELGGRQPHADGVVHDRHHALRLAFELGAEAERISEARDLKDRVAELCGVGWERGLAALARLLGELPVLARRRPLRLDRLAVADGGGFRLPRSSFFESRRPRASVIAGRRRRSARFRAGSDRQPARRQTLRTAVTTPSRSGALRRSWRRCLPRSRNRGAGPSTGTSDGSTSGEPPRGRSRRHPERGPTRAHRTRADEVGVRRIPQSAAALELGARNPAVSCIAAWRIAGASGASVWTRTRPPFRPRPLRPANWATSAKVRSSDLKSGNRSVASASRTTLSTTSGKSCPLPTICVPTSTPASEASNGAGCRDGRRPARRCRSPGGTRAAATPPRRSAPPRARSRRRDGPA